MSTTQELPDIEIPAHLLEALRLTAASRVSIVCANIGNSFGYGCDDDDRAQFLSNYRALTRAIDILEQLDNIDGEPRRVFIDGETLLPLARAAAIDTSYQVQNLVEQGVTDIACADEIVKWTTASRDLMALVALYENDRGD